MSKRKKQILLSVICFIISIVFTILVKHVDVAPIGPEGSIVGFSKLNNAVHNLIGVNMLWYDITKVLGIIVFAWPIYHCILGLMQVIKEKSLWKVDKKIIILGFFYIILACVYVLFEKMIINYRPTIIDGELEASYPSSHTMLAICVCGASILTSKYFIHNEKIRKILNILTWIVMLTTIIGRIISGVHWASDIIGGIIISIFLLNSLRTAITIVEKE